jgi:hypothetical protein
MIIYSTVTESYEGIFYPDSNLNILVHKDNRLNDEFDENLRGLKIVKWMHSGQLLAVSGQNETVTIN